MIEEISKFRGQEEIAEEWNEIASIRFNQLMDGKDISFDKILIPTIINDIPLNKKVKAIDIGCGVGYATSKFSNSVEKIVGVDISNNSIELAKANFEKNSNIQFFNSSIQNFSLKNENCFDLAIANMALMDMPDLNNCIQAISKILKPNSLFIATITHPYFWPFYWNYASESWFEYHKEIQIKAPFKISNNKTTLLTTHIHRPISLYLNSIIGNGFTLTKLEEPMPDKIIEDNYPNKWDYPRFLKMVFKKNTEANNI